MYDRTADHINLRFLSSTTVFWNTYWSSFPIPSITIKVAKWQQGFRNVFYNYSSDSQTIQSHTIISSIVVQFLLICRITTTTTTTKQISLMLQDMLRILKRSHVQIITTTTYCSFQRQMYIDEGFCVTPFGLIHRLEVRNIATVNFYYWPLYLSRES